MHTRTNNSFFTVWCTHTYYTLYYKNVKNRESDCIGTRQCTMQILNKALVPFALCILSIKGILFHSTKHTHRERKCVAFQRSLIHLNYTKFTDLKSLKNGDNIFVLFKFSYANWVSVAWNQRAYCIKSTQCEPTAHRKTNERASLVLLLYLFLLTTAIKRKHLNAYATYSYIQHI